MKVRITNLIQEGTGVLNYHGVGIGNITEVRYKLGSNECVATVNGDVSENTDVTIMTDEQYDIMVANYEAEILANPEPIILNPEQQKIADLEAMNAELRTQLDAASQAIDFILMNFTPTV